MAAGDTRAQQTDVASNDVELAPDTVKDDPVDMPRLPEGTVRADFYAGANQKDVLPEHAARRDRYPHITTSTP